MGARQSSMADTCPPTDTLLLAALLSHEADPGQLEGWALKEEDTWLRGRGQRVRLSDSRWPHQPQRVGTITKVHQVTRWHVWLVVTCQEESGTIPVLLRVPFHSQYLDWTQRQRVRGMRIRDIGRKKPFPPPTYPPVEESAECRSSAQSPVTSTSILPPSPTFSQALAGAQPGHAQPGRPLSSGPEETLGKVLPTWMWRAD